MGRGLERKGGSGGVFPEMSGRRWRGSEGFWAIHAERKKRVREKRAWRGKRGMLVAGREKICLPTFIFSLVAIILFFLTFADVSYKTSVIHYLVDLCRRFTENVGKSLILPTFF